MEQHCHLLCFLHTIKDKATFGPLCPISDKPKLLLYYASSSQKNMQLQNVCKTCNFETVNKVFAKSDTVLSYLDKTTTRCASDLVNSPGWITLNCQQEKANLYTAKAFR